MVNFRMPSMLYLTLTICLGWDTPFIYSQTGTAVLENLTDDQKATTDDTRCMQPAPLFSAADYEGPLKKLVVYFSRKPEIKTVHTSRHPGLRICALDATEKFKLFVEDSIEPVTFVGAAFDAGLSQAEDQDASFGQGAIGYGKRYGATIADSVSNEFFHTYFFPVIFKQDPRYYRRLEGNTRKRLEHALSHVFVAQGDSGRKMFNFSEWLGTASTVALSNAYHPDNSRGVGPASGRIGISVAEDMGFDVVREFWPEIVRKLKLPFRQRDQVIIRRAPTSLGQGS